MKVHAKVIHRLLSLLLLAAACAFGAAMMSWGTTSARFVDTVDVTTVHVTVRDQVPPVSGIPLPLRPLVPTGVPSPVIPTAAHGPDRQGWQWAWRWRGPSRIRVPLNGLVINTE